MFQQTDDGADLTVRIRKSNTDQESQGALRSLLPTGSFLCPTTASISWFRLRGWGSESGRFVFPKMRPVLYGVLKFDALSNNVPVESISTHSLRAGGTTAMFRACYGLLEVEEWGDGNRRASTVAFGMICIR